MFKKIILLTIFLILPYYKLFAIGNLFTIELTPAFRLSSANFNDEAINLFTIQNFFNQTRLSKFAFNYNYAPFQLYVDVDFLKQHIDVFTDNPSFSNFPYNDGFVGSINATVPLQGFFAYRGDLINVIVGRSRWHFGAGDYSLVAGRDVPYFDGVWFSFNPQLSNGRLHFNFWAASDEQRALEKFLAWQPEGALHLQQNSRWFFAHRFGFSRESWRLGLTETMIFMGEPLNLSVISPLYLWHNLYMDSAANVAITLDFEKIFTNQNIRLYAEFSLDDFQLPWEAIDSNPQAIALYLGADWQIFDNGERFTAPRFDPFAQTITMDNFAFDGGLVVTLQALWASRFIWGRSQELPLGKFTLFKNIHDGNNGVIEHYLAFPYGGDNIYLKAGAEWQNSQFFVTGSLGVLLQGNDAAKVTGYLNRNHPEPQAVHIWSEETARNWAYSGLAHTMLLVNSTVHYALTHYASAYTSLNSRLVLNDFSQSSALFELGVFLRF
ncbi:MAG: hypothetical protein FWE37_04245 [Spirochaetaceae bacterium]|nr:hypothetical protein [Spirochaetaceae bacterium]